MGKLKWNYNPCKEVKIVGHKQGDICRYNGSDHELVIIRTGNDWSTHFPNTCTAIFLTGVMAGQNITASPTSFTPMTAYITAEEAK